jgi:hypothetical protein
VYWLGKPWPALLGAVKAAGFLGCFAGGAVLVHFVTVALFLAKPYWYDAALRHFSRCRGLQYRVVDRQPKIWLVNKAEFIYSLIIRPSPPLSIHNPTSEDAMPTDLPSASDSPNPDYDTPWKIAVERHFPLFMAFYFPKAHAQINWQQPYQFLDQELLAIAKDAVVGTKHVDKLVRVTRLSGHEDWLCIHIEVQVGREPKFAERMFTYNYRIFDHYAKPVASMAVLGDDDEDWLPQCYGYEVMDCEMSFRFPIVKLASFAGQEATLGTHPNPFALLTLAYLQTRQTRRDMQARFTVKCKLIRMLLARQWDEHWIREFFMVIDWMMALPTALASEMTKFVVTLKEEREMEYVTTVERYLREKIRQEYLTEGKHGAETALLIRLLNRRFGQLPPARHAQIMQASGEQIQIWFDRGVDAKTLDDVFQDMPNGLDLPH